MFVVGESRQFKCRMLIDIVHALYTTPGMCSESRDVFKFSEINDNMSKTVQCRDIATMED